MPRLSDEPGLSRRCTNRCIRDMEASNLCDAGVSNMGIMTVTVHRNVQFLKEASTLKSPNLNRFKVLESKECLTNSDLLPNISLVGIQS